MSEPQLPQAKTQDCRQARCARCWQESPPGIGRHGEAPPSCGRGCLPRVGAAKPVLLTAMRLVPRLQPFPPAAAHTQKKRDAEAPSSLLQGVGMCLPIHRTLHGFPPPVIGCCLSKPTLLGLKHGHKNSDTCRLVNRLRKSFSQLRADHRFPLHYTDISRRIVSQSCMVMQQFMLPCRTRTITCMT